MVVAADLVDACKYVLDALLNHVELLYRVHAKGHCAIWSFAKPAELDEVSLRYFEKQGAGRGL